RHPHPRALHSFPTRRSSDLASRAWNASLMRRRLSASKSRIRLRPGDFIGLGPSTRLAEILAEPVRRAIAIRHLFGADRAITLRRSEEHTSELQSRSDLVCRL